MVGIGDQARDHVDHEVGDTAVAGEIDLADVLDLVVDGLDQRPLAQQQLVEQRHEAVGHVFAEPRDELQILRQQGLEQGLGDVALGQPFGQMRDGGAVVDVARRHLERQQLAPVVDHQVQLEAVKPAYRGLAAPGQLFEHLVAADAAVVADDDGGRVDEGDAGDRALTLLEVGAQRHQHRLRQRDHVRVAGQAGKLAPEMAAHFVQVVGLEATVLRLVEMHEDRHQLAGAQARGAPPLALPGRQLLSMPGGQEGFAKVVDVAKQGDEAGDVVHGQSRGLSEIPRIVPPSRLPGNFRLSRTHVKPDNLPTQGNRRRNRVVDGQGGDEASVARMQSEII